MKDVFHTLVATRRLNLDITTIFSILHIPYHTCNILIVLEDSVSLEIDVTFVSILFIYSYLLSAYRFLKINKNKFASFRIILDYPHLQVKQISDKLKREAINGKNHWYALVLLALLAI